MGKRHKPTKHQTPRPSRTPSKKPRTSHPEQTAARPRTWGEMLGIAAPKHNPQNAPGKPAKSPVPKARPKAQKPRTSQPEQPQPRPRKVRKAVPQELLSLESLQRDIDRLARKDSEVRKRLRHFETEKARIERALEVQREKHKRLVQAREKTRAALDQGRVQESRVLSDAFVKRKVGRYLSKREAQRVEYLEALEKRFGRGLIDQYQDLAVWAGRFEAPKSSVEPNADGTIDAQIELPEVRDVQSLVEVAGRLLKDLDARYWVRVGWRFDIEAGARSRYNSERFAVVQAYWQRAGDPRIYQPPQGKSVEQLNTASRIHDAMLQDRFGHKILGAVITVHWSSEGTKPDRR